MIHQLGCEAGIDVNDAPDPLKVFAVTIPDAFIWFTSKPAEQILSVEL